MTFLPRLTAASLLLAGLAAGTASAQTPPPPQDGRPGPRAEDMRGPMPPHRLPLDFAAIDTSSDGTLSRDELTQRATSRLSRTDTNGDGTLDRSEIVAAMPTPPGSFMMVFTVDPAEAHADRMLQMMGAGDAGQVDVAAIAERQVNALLARYDTDFDGAITRAEADAARRHGPKRQHGPEGKHGKDRWKGHRA